MPIPFPFIPLNFIGQAYVQILVTDENDNPPIFERKAYNASVLESQAEETSILVVKANDRDEGKSGPRA